MFATLAFLALAHQSAVISGVCEDGLKHPAPQILIQVMNRRGQSVWTGMSDEHGGFRAEVPPGSFPCRLEYRTPTGASRKVKVPLAIEGLTLKLNQVRVRIFTHDATGKILPGAVVQGYFLKPTPKTVMSAGGKPVPYGDGKGTPERQPFETAGVSDLYVDRTFLRSVKCVASQDDLASVEPARTDGEAVISVTVSKGAWTRLNLDFIDQKGQPVKVSSLSVRGEVTGEANRGQGSKDSYSFNHLFAGQPYEVSVEKEDYAVGEGSFGRVGYLKLSDLKAGVKTSRTIQLYPLSDKVGGDVVDATGKPRAGVAVFSEDPGRFQSWDAISTLTDKKGHFVLAKVFRMKGKLVTVEGGSLDNHLEF